MSAPRLAAIPLEHLEAELAAFPIASEASFQLGITSLQPQVSVPGNDKLWLAAEQHVLNALPSVPHDEAVTIRDRLWFNSENLNTEISNFQHMISDSVSLRQYVTQLAARYLELDGRAKASESHAVNRGERARLQWSWICQALPPDLLRVVRNVANADSDPFPLESEVEGILKGGFAETHLHLGAALDFPLAWAGLMVALSSNETKHSDFQSPGAYFDNGRILTSWLLHAAVVRLVLADWLFNNGADMKSLEHLLIFASNRPGRRLGLLDRHRLKCLLREVSEGTRFGPLSNGLTEDYLERRFARTRALYRRLSGPAFLFGRGLPSASDLINEQEVFANDPLSQIVGWSPTQETSPEALFVSKALNYLEERGQEDGDFARLFWQSLRIRCLLYRHVVQRPLTPGLQWFVRFFSRIKPLRKNLPEIVLASAAARLSGQNAGLTSLEVRLGTEDSESQCLQKARVLQKTARSLTKSKTHRYFRHRQQSLEADPPGDKLATFEIGALFHFSRKRGGGWEQGKPNAFGLDHSYPGIIPRRSKLEHAGNPTGFRFARFYLEQRRHAQALVNMFEKYPKVLYTVRGIDLCTDEAGIPVWVMAPLVEWVRCAGRAAAQQLTHRGEPDLKFRTSVHAGEDFVNLLTGLRRLDEAVTRLHLEKKDRLGHALALALDPKKWCSRVGRVVQSREERLFDLIWEWSLSSGKYRPRNYLKHQVQDLANSIFGAPNGVAYTLEDLAKFVELLHDQNALKSQGFPNRPARKLRHSQSLIENDRDIDGTLRARFLLATYLGDESVWQRGRFPVEIDVHGIPHEEVALRGLQNALKRKIRRLDLTIEVNPSSNLLVGDLGTFNEHPIWNLKPVSRWSHFSRRRTSVCIGSDDPLTFATNLPHEYQLLYDAMVLMNHSKKVALRWLEDVRETGLRSRFTISRMQSEFVEELRIPSLLRPLSCEAPP